VRRYFITGGTGLIGSEIIRQLLDKPDTAVIWCLTRQSSLVHDDARVHYLTGDITTVEFPHVEFSDVIHGANEVNDLLQPDQFSYYYTITEGTNRLLKWAATRGIKRRLILSSGAVARETIYGRAKRQCEILAHYYVGETKIARIFSVVGPKIPLNGQYAVGRFVGSALNGCVEYYGGGSQRTYLDVTDCARYLLTILDDAMPLVPIDVAGPQMVTMDQLAHMVGKVFNVPVKKIDGPDRSDVYLPDLDRAIALGLRPSMTLEQSLGVVRDYYR
jgi:nucleoside-diphosphate-sugar epimerase